MNNHQLTPRDDLLFTARDDAVRSKFFDELMTAEDTSKDLSDLWYGLAFDMAEIHGLTFEQAKALCASLIILVSSDPVEKSAYIARAEAIIRGMQWAEADKRKEVKQ